MIPKPFLEIEYRGTSVYMLQHVINTIPFGSDEISIAVPPGHVFEAPGIKSYEISDTKGPAHTALKMIPTLGHQQSCLILDSDVLNFTNDLIRLTGLDSCGVLVSGSANPAFSYVDQKGVFSQIIEKERISEYAVRGAYYISWGAMLEFIRQLELVVKKESEPYISHVFNKLRLEKFAIETTYFPVEWGTPRDIKLSGARIISEKGG
jgi:hypothetical protein